MIEYTDQGKGPTTLSLHGAMGGYEQGEILAQTITDPVYRTIAVSRPGYLNTPLSSGVTPAEQADLCADLLSELGIAKACLLAVSGGGPTAINFALRHPHRCWGMVLVSTCAGPLRSPIPLSFHLTKFLARFDFLVRFMGRRLEKNLDKGASRSIPDGELRRRVLTDPEVGPLFKRLLMSTVENMGQRLTGTNNDIRLTRESSFALTEIRVPTLVVHGTNDRVVPFAEHAIPLTEQIPGAELLRIEGGEHVAIFTHREQVKSRVSGFMAGLTVESGDQTRG